MNLIVFQYAPILPLLSMLSLCV